MAKKKNRRPRRSYTPEFKAETVRLVKSGGKSIPQVAKDLDLTESAVRGWVERAQEHPSVSMVLMRRRDSNPRRSPWQKGGSLRRVPVNTCDDRARTRSGEDQGGLFGTSADIRGV